MVELCRILKFSRATFYRYLQKSAA
ncbi:MAG: hypothetical protein IBJ00_05990 [Alphaproteobacteria bacterium]|nr:hypothetical protein [Alphaproteobacteria bacterium]